METVTYLTGLDLGQPADCTALAVLERTSAPDPAAPGRDRRRYAVRHLERFPRGTPYPEVGARLARRFATPPLAGTVLGIDQTGVGPPVVDLLRRARISARLRPVTVPAGRQAGGDGHGGWLVPKAALVSTVPVLLQARRLQVASRLAETPALVRELADFRSKVPATASNPLVSWREGPHDDLVLAVALAAWLGERALRRLQMW